MLECRCALGCIFFFFIHILKQLNFYCVFSSSAGCADPNSLDSLSLQEKKRQDYIDELIKTEERYVEDLHIVLEVMGPAEVAA